MKTTVKLTAAEEEMLTIKKLGLLENLIDDRCDCFSVRNTIAYLMDNNITEKELLTMGFDQEDIDAAKAGLVDEDDLDDDDKYGYDKDYYREEKNL